MYKLPSRGRGLWREEFYSFHSSPTAQEADVNHEFGMWRNVWIGRLSSAVYRVCPPFWRWWVNLPPFHRRMTKKLQRHFPNIR